MNSSIESTKSIFQQDGNTYCIFRLDLLPESEPEYWEKLPYSIRVLLEGALRHYDGTDAALEAVYRLAQWTPQGKSGGVIPFSPARVVLQDFTGVPVMNDLAALRSEMAARGGDPLRVNPVIPVDLVIDHSVMVDEYGHPQAAAMNARLEFLRNRERFQFLHWCEQAFDNFRVIPPASGIIHQVNLEYLARLLAVQEIQGETLLFPETLIGTDSHTTMINGLGLLGWGVGGIEAIAAMMGQPIEIGTPEVVGLRISGRLPKGATPTDLTLTIIQRLRKLGMVDKFIEACGPGLAGLSLADRAMIANMAPECGATSIYFPVDEQTLNYLSLTGKPESHVRLVEAYYRAQHLFRSGNSEDPFFSQVVEINLEEIEPSLAGPKYPHERVRLKDARSEFRFNLVRSRAEGGYGISEVDLQRREILEIGNERYSLGHGFLALAAITSCTNTSNPTVMIAAGLLAKKAVELGLRVPAYVKTSLAPGSRVVSAYLQNGGLLEQLGKLGFHIAGYGCTTCIGNSGPLDPAVEELIENRKILAASILSGNRNFEGRINPHVQANYLASPPLVVAYALAGTVDIDLNHQPLGLTPDHDPVYLKDIWPEPDEVQAVVSRALVPDIFIDAYAHIAQSSPDWLSLSSTQDKVYSWQVASTYLQKPPFLELDKPANAPVFIQNGRALLLLGDSITTDHISPAGAIAPDSAAGRFLLDHKVTQADFNSYGARRGNHHVMMRGTFANPRLKNLLAAGVEGGFTPHLPDGEVMEVFEAAAHYMAEGTPLIVIAGKNYGTGSSRDWAAKGPRLLGVQAVLAQSFERIHRSNLAGMGILPLEFLPGESAVELGLDGTEIFTIEGLEPLHPGKILNIRAEKVGQKTIEFKATARLNTSNEVQYFYDGGIMKTILRGLSEEAMP